MTDTSRSALTETDPLGHALAPHRGFNLPCSLCGRPFLSVAASGVVMSHRGVFCNDTCALVWVRDNCARCFS